MRIVAIADTHGRYREMPVIPPGDVLVHAGDLTAYGQLSELPDFFSWFRAQPHRWKILVAGNHDRAFERAPTEARRELPDGILYLQDSGVTIEGVRFWGSPWQPFFNNWAFNLERSGADLAAKWALIPADVQVLITHSPPFGILDGAGWQRVESVGCELLRDRIASLPQLQAHLFGHVHEAYGTACHGRVQYANASICTYSYAPTNLPIVVELRDEQTE